jgi:hypothetical protein
MDIIYKNTIQRKKTSPIHKRLRLKPISLYPLKPSEALKAFMEIDPKKVKKSQPAKAR